MTGSPASGWLGTCQTAYQRMSVSAEPPETLSGSLHEDSLAAGFTSGSGSTTPGSKLRSLTPCSKAAMWGSVRSGASTAQESASARRSKSSGSWGSTMAYGTGTWGLWLIPPWTSWPHRNIQYIIIYICDNVYIYIYIITYTLIYFLYTSCNAGVRRLFELHCFQDIFVSSVCGEVVTVVASDKMTLIINLSMS